MQKISGGSLITKILFENGINKAFCVPGESYLGVLEAIRLYKKKFDLVVCRHEGGASYMAEAYGRLTKIPGVCLVTRGPGACNAAIGVHTAFHEGTPMILFVGQVPVSSLKKNAFQSIDTDKVFKSISKHCETIKNHGKIQEIIEEAIRISTEGKPGPVVISIPEDIQFAMIEAPLINRNKILTSKLNSKKINELKRDLNNSKRPIIILSGSKWTETSKNKIEKFSRTNSIPIAVTFRKGDLFDNKHKNYVGSLGVGPDPNLVSYVKSSDAILLIGGEFGEIETSKFSYLTKSSNEQKIFHVTEDQKLVLKSDHKIINSDLVTFCDCLTNIKVSENKHLKSVTKFLRQSYESYIEPKKFKNKFNPGVAVKDISHNLPASTIITAGAGNYSHFVLRHHLFRKLNTLLAPINAPMGYSVPSSITASILNRNKEIICYAGDGCFMMNFQEIVIAVKRSLKITFIIFNNGIYGSIRMHQEFKYPGKTIATNLDNPDFNTLAKSFGLRVANINNPNRLFKIYQQLRNNYNGPIMINMKTDPEIINPQKTIKELNN